MSEAQRKPTWKDFSRYRSEEDTSLCWVPKLSLRKHLQPIAKAGSKLTKGSPSKDFWDTKIRNKKPKTKATV